MLTCEETEPELGAYLDGELNPRERATIEAHLVLCEKCNAVLNQIEFARKSLTALPKLSAPPALAPRILAVMRNDLTQTPADLPPVSIKLPTEPVRLFTPTRHIPGPWPWAAFASGAAAMAMVSLMGYVVLAPSSDKLARVTERSDQLTQNAPINAPAATLEVPILRKAARPEPDFSAATSRPSDPTLRNFPAQPEQTAQSAHPSGDLRANQNAALARDKAEPQVAQVPAPAMKNAENIEKQMTWKDGARSDAAAPANLDAVRKLDLTENRVDNKEGVPKPAAAPSDKSAPPLEAEKLAPAPFRGAASAKRAAALDEQLQHNETETRVRSALGAPGKAPAPSAPGASVAPPATTSPAPVAATPVSKAPLVVIVRTPDVVRAIVKLRELAAKLNASVEYSRVAEKETPAAAKTPSLGFGGKKISEVTLTAAPQQRSAVLNELYALQAESLKYSSASKSAAATKTGAGDEFEDISALIKKIAPTDAGDKSKPQAAKLGEQLTIKVEFYKE